MLSILRTRFHVGAWAILVVIVILLLQNSLSDLTSLGRLIPHHSHLFSDAEMINRIWDMVKLVVLVPMLTFWALDCRKLLRISVVVSNLLLTFQLLISTLLLVLTLGTDNFAQVAILIRDTLLVMVINILIFSLWYWIIDSPILQQKTSREPEPWDFLFPQRINSLPGYDDWGPGFTDYIFLAFTTTFTFGPADTLPLSGRAKALMLLQVTVSVINIVVLAGRSLSIIGAN